VISNNSRFITFNLKNVIGGTLSHITSWVLVLTRLESSRAEGCNGFGSAHLFAQCITILYISSGPRLHLHSHPNHFRDIIICVSTIHVLLFSIKFILLYQYLLITPPFRSRRSFLNLDCFGLLLTR
jgi:hypothetical protein